VQLVSRHPEVLYNKISSLGSQILPPKSFDLTSSDTSPLKEALQDADAVVSMVGLLVAPEKKMIEVQQHGAEKVSRIAKEVGVGRAVLVSAIGADPGGVTP
jgi:NADH dehydrogenase